MWFKNKKDKERIKELEKELESQKEKNKDLVELFTKKENIDKDRDACDVDISFEKLNIFSIERANTLTSDQEKTVIGWLEPDEKGVTVTREWNLWISRKQHNELIKKFREYKNSQPKSVKRKSKNHRSNT